VQRVVAAVAVQREVLVADAGRAGRERRGLRLRAHRREEESRTGRERDAGDESSAHLISFDLRAAPQGLGCRSCFQAARPLWKRAGPARKAAASAENRSGASTGCELL
jgi:hypothetical protein